MKNEIIKIGNHIHIKTTEYINLAHIFDCGQCFRWEQNQDNSYTGVAFGKVINVSVNENEIIIKNSSIEDVDNIWKKYLDLDKNYKEIQEKIIEHEPKIKEMVAFGRGIRLLNQDEWETTISFIISQNRSISLIKKSIELLSEQYGTYIEKFKGKDYYCFPTPSQLARASIEDIAKCKVGYRGKYIIEVAKTINKESEKLYEQSKKTDEEALAYLLSLHGVGPKVANCIKLFSMEKYDSFPIDVWIKRALEKYFKIKVDQSKKTEKRIKKMFPKHGGIAQQYIFYYAINNQK